MAENDKKGGEFHCYVCHMKENYIYYGEKPKFAPSYVFLEPVYLMKDPFSPSSPNSFLLLGSNCAVCGKMVCQGQECSLFFSKRFCLNCARLNLLEFPPEIQQEINKRSQAAE